MTTVSPPPVRNSILQFADQDPEPPSRWHRFLPHSRRAKIAIAGGLTVLLVAGVLGTTYETSPGGTLWGVEKTIFPEHAQDVALTAVVNDLKQAQDILDSGEQPTPDQLTAARTSLNQAKEDLDYLSASPQRTSLQNLYLQLTQQLLQYTPATVQQLPPLPIPPVADPSSPAPDVSLTSASAPSWGYPISDQSAATDEYGSPPPGVPDAPQVDWSQPYAPPLTPNLADLGYYDPSWAQLYGYDAGDWYNYGLNGYNQYGYDFLGFDRWGYDRWGYDRWGYDRRGYNWAGYNWAGYDRDGWDRDGRNDWGQRRGFPGDPRNQDWHNDHHTYERYYQWRFDNDDPVYRRTQWDHAHGINPDLYRNWNANRNWHDPRNRDWAPLSRAATVTAADIHVSSPVVNLNASLTQFISNAKAANPGPSIKDLADKSTRELTRELAPRVTLPDGLQPISPLAQQVFAASTAHHTSFTPPALTAPAPMPPPSRVAPGFSTPALPPIPAFTPSKSAQPQPKSESAPARVAPGRDREPSPMQTVIPPNPHSQKADEAQAPLQRTAPQPPTRALPAPGAEAPLAQPPAPEAPARQVPVHQAPVPRTREEAPQQGARQAPPVHDSPPAPRPAPEQHSASAPAGPKCVMPSVCG